MRFIKSIISVIMCFSVSSCQIFASYNSAESKYGKLLVTKATYGGLLFTPNLTDVWNKYENCNIIEYHFDCEEYVEICFFTDGKITVKSFHGEELVGYKGYKDGQEYIAFGSDFLIELKDDFINTENPITPRALWNKLHNFESFSI